jgi:beta-lactamase regulating signal transducer with metallopeptidase domain
MAILDRVLGIALANAAAAIALALVAALVGRFTRRPAAAHALWVLVLLKLVTPPVWTVPVKVAVAPADPPRASNLVAAEPVRGDRPIDSPTTEVETPPAVSSGIGVADHVTPAPSRDDETMPAPHAWAHRQPRAAAANSAANSAAAPTPAPPIRRLNWSRWRPALIWSGCAVWFVGSAAFLIIVVVRVARFRRCLRYALPGHPDLQDRTAALSRQMGIRGCPPVWLVPGAVSPMLWALGKARILVPAELWDRLDDAERDALLAHELAHLRRRDHWVRWLEVLATAAYWWHPVCWWARRALREAEEQCCDAWVLWARPGGLPAYAAALLETLDFLSARPGSDPPGAADRGRRSSSRPVRSSVPMLASGMGQFHQLKRRFVMLKQGDVPRALTRRGLMAVFTLGGLLLPVVPTFAQALAPTPAPKPQSVAAPDQGSAREDDDERVSKKQDGADDRKREKLDELKKARDAQQSARDAQARARDDMEKAIRDNKQQAELQKQLAESRMEVQKLAASLAAAEARMRKLEMAAGGGGQPDGKAYWGNNKPAPDAKLNFTPPRESKGYVGSGSGDRGGDRLDAIEQQLQGLLQEVKAMRAERKAEDRFRKDTAKSKDGPKSSSSSEPLAK